MLLYNTRPSWHHRQADVHATVHEVLGSHVRLHTCSGILHTDPDAHSGSFQSAGHTSAVPPAIHTLLLNASWHLQLLPFKGSHCNTATGAASNDAAVSRVTLYTQTPRKKATAFQLGIDGLSTARLPSARTHKAPGAATERPLTMNFTGSRIRSRCTNHQPHAGKGPLHAGSTRTPANIGFIFQCAVSSDNKSPGT